MYRVEPLLSAHMYARPQVSGRELYFLSNLSGLISLYSMPTSGGQSRPLLPANIALQNPHQMEGESFYVFPGLRRILVMIDHDGDEKYQPMLIPLEGGTPQPAFKDTFAGRPVHLAYCDPQANLAYLVVEAAQEQMIGSYRTNLASGEVKLLDEGQWGSVVDAISQDHRRAILIDNYTAGDNVLYLWTEGQPGRRLLYGKPLEQRHSGQHIPINAISSTHFTPGEKGLLFITALFYDNYSLGYLDLANPSAVKTVEILGRVHTGSGELTRLTYLRGNNYQLEYNIDGCSWVYEAEFNERQLSMRIQHVLVGQGELSNGVLEAIQYNREGDRFALSFCTATSPTQIYLLVGAQRRNLSHVAGDTITEIPQERLSAGEDVSFASYDDNFVSARLYLPTRSLGFSGPRPLIYYIHGGPQSQERPDFAWFSMPLIQLLTLNGFAVFVPNVRGSSGYGLRYMKKVDHDWGGNDRLDHVYAMQERLPHDGRLDLSRTGVVGRSYGGYMSLMLAGRHPELWSAAVDMFGPYDLLTFSERIPESWKPNFRVTVGDPEIERDFLIERSPRTYLKDLRCPLLVIQGKNDRRVIERESLDLVEELRGQQKQVEYLVFENEGHDVLKIENRITVYTTITDFFKRVLKP
jgi:pimeloyl-ACP methyl ester carboxylesterase